MKISEATTAWLMAGDPAIRWQTMRDLLDYPETDWQAEQRLTMTQGWGARLLASQDVNGIWGGGIYSPKWTSSTYTLLSLHHIGIPADCPPAQRGTGIVLDHMLGTLFDTDLTQRLNDIDLCIVGMLLQLGAYFQVNDPRLDLLVDNILAETMPDGAWNCRRHRAPKPHHSSFHTTANVLDGLRTYLESGGVHRKDELLAAEHNALKLILDHRLFRSDKTGDVINERWMRLSFPHRWHYDVLRGLCYFARIGAPRDERMSEAVELIKASFFTMHSPARF